jgi:hypothetical protein
MAPGASPIGGMPAVRYGQPQQPAARSPYTAGGVQSGGYGQQGVPSGGYGAMSAQSGGYAGGGDNNRMPLLIAIAVLAGILVVVLIVLIGKSGDDGGDAGNGGDGGTEDPGGDSQDGYTQAIHDEFVGACTTNATEEQCECVYEEISTNVPFDDFLEYDTALRSDSSATPPSWFNDAIAAC